MRRIYCVLTAILVVVTVALLTTSSRVKAVVYGFVDTDNVFTNTGAFIVKSPTSENIFPICSGTLISPTVFLTASHCTVFFENDLAPLGFTPFVSFDNPIPFGDLTSKKTNLIPVTRSSPTRTSIRVRAIRAILPFCWLVKGRHEASLRHRYLSIPKIQSAA